MRSGICPKCRSARVYTQENGVGLGGDGWRRGVLIATSSVAMPSPIQSYICAACGYMENYLLDAGKLAEVAEKWQQVSSAPPPSFDFDE